MNSTVKTELHKLIDECKNEVLLAEAKELLLSATANDWWDELTAEDRNLLEMSKIEYQKGNFISHTILMEQFEEWRQR